jgi:segregation and condensation protein B
MSLKAKIEAVIYASEEPVTLAQLTGLLGEEGQAELNALAAQQHSLALEDEGAVVATEEPELADEAVTAADDASPNTPEPIFDADALNAETTGPNETLDSASAEPEPTPEPGAPGVASDTWDAEEPEPQAPSAEPQTSAPATDDKKLARDAAATTKLRERKLRDHFRLLLDQLIADYANGDRGLEIREVAGGFRLGTKAEYHDAVRGFVKSLKPPLKLTLQALETLAVVAYKQPVTAPEVSEIRGVDSAGVLGSLLTRKLVTTAGRKQVIGRPILYKTTKDFLLRFGLKDINELPSIEEFEKMAGELNDAVQEEIPMDQSLTEPSPTSEAPTTEPELPATEPGAPGLASETWAAAEPASEAPTTDPEFIPETSADLEPSANLHSPQADGTPEDDDDPEDPEDDGSTVLPNEPPTDAEPTDEPEPN